MSISKEAIEAASKAVRDVLWDTPALTFVGYSFSEREADRTKAVERVSVAALTAALPHLAQPREAMSETHCDQCGGPFSSAHSDRNLRIQLAAKDAEIAALRERTRLPTAQALARAIFDNGGCSEQRCAWGERPCDCQERGEACALIALRALAALEMSGGVK